MIILVNLALLGIFLLVGSVSLLLWGRAVTKLYNGEPILAPERRFLPEVGISELLIGFGVMVLVSSLLAPFVVPKKDQSQAGKIASETTVDESKPATETAQESNADTSQQANTSEKTEKPEASSKPPLDLDYLIGMIVLNSIATLLATCAILGWMKLRGLSLSRAGILPTVNHIGIGVVGAVMLLPPVMILQAVLASQIRYEHPLLEVLQKEITWQVMLAMAVSASVIAPLVEEIYFRGVLQGFLDKLSVAAVFDRKTPVAVYSPTLEPDEKLLLVPQVDGDSEGVQMPMHGRAWWPGVVSSLIFALAHAGQGPAPITLFFLALGIAYLFRQTGSIWPGLVVHFVLNATSTGTMILLTLLGSSVQ